MSYPYSHSAVALAAASLAFAGVYLAGKRSSLLAATTLGALVFSHWVLDVITHRPDLPLTLSGPSRVGLGLWQSVPATLAVELTLFLVCVWIYARATVARRRTQTSWPPGRRSSSSSAK